MQIHHLKLVMRRKRKKRVGRGGKRGTYSGRGQKGQKSRAGRSILRGEREIILKLPKLRGIKNRSLNLKPKVFNVRDLEKRFSKETVINKKVFLEKGLIQSFKENVKILGEGEINKPLVIEGLEVSKSAREKILKAGGQIR